MSDLLTLCAHLPTVTYRRGEVVVHEGSPPGSIWVLSTGSLQVLKSSVVVNEVSRPGAVIGEMSVFLGSPAGATVMATSSTTMLHAADGQAFLSANPDVTWLVAAGLAERVNFMSRYLADLRHQYGDAPGLSMVAEVLGELSQRQVPAARHGSARDPDPEH